jgi:hypothetical protein
MVQVEFQNPVPGFQAGKNAVFHRVADFGVFPVSPDIQGDGKLIGLIETVWISHGFRSTMRVMG